MNLRKNIVRLYSCNSIRGFLLNPEDFLLTSEIRILQIIGKVIAKSSREKRLKIIHSAKKDSSKLLLISIILPVLNSEDSIQIAIKSIQKQSYQNWELLVIDDGSTDNSLKIINEIAKKDSRIKVYHNIKNKGVAYARNVGLHLAKGDYITFHDADDTSHPERLEFLLAEILSDSKCKIVISQYVRINAEGEILSMNGRRKRNYISGMMFKRNMISKIGYLKPLKISEDSEYHERILATFGKKSRKVLCKTLYYALFNPDSLLFSNANVSIDNKSVDYKITSKERLILETFKLEHKQITSGKLSPYQDFTLDEEVTMRINSHE